MEQQNRSKRLKSSPKTTKKNKAICKYWLEGTCGKGDECSFSHEGQPITQQSEVCRYFLTGSCLKGKKCPFSHNISLVPCKFYHAKGFCSMGNSCKYSHNPIDTDMQEKIRKDYTAYQKYDRKQRKQPEIVVSSEESDSSDQAVELKHSLNPELNLKIYQLPSIFENISIEEQAWIDEAIKKYKPFTSPF